MRKKKYTSVSIPVELADKIKKEIKGTGFQNVSDYVIFIMRDVISMKGRGTKKILTKEDQEKIKTKLKSLGYL